MKPARVWTSSDSVNGSTVDRRKCLHGTDVRALSIASHMEALMEQSNQLSSSANVFKGGAVIQPDLLVAKEPLVQCIIKAGKLGFEITHQRNIYPTVSLRSRQHVRVGSTRHPMERSSRIAFPVRPLWIAQSR